ncbi:hypothetical protein EDC04DRAFT_2921123 [Pisolithus marmoratus]|nr:hypothetical protein EDC04DRAFT_2921123 [Pisolithus marmoratus]
MSAMDEDVDMDAPQISTLLEENTPPPTRTSKFRVKLLVGEKKNKGKGSPPSVSAAARKSVQSGPTPVPSDEDVEEEDEEDQLIYDDDGPAPSTVATTNTTVGTKRKAPAKKPRPRKSDKQDKDIDKTGRYSAVVAPKKLSRLTEPQERGEQPEEPAPGLAVAEKAPKKKAATRKPPAASRAKGRATKAPITLTVPPMDDTAMSETPSSPFPMEGQEAGQSPDVGEVEQPPLPTPEGPAEIAPLPVYPLPSKPFPVQPPPKIGTGFASMLPLDRSGTKVRRWRVANREIRGIAGGRWFSRSWVGDKESEFAAAAIAAKHAEGDKAAKAVTSISASGGRTGRAKAPRGSAGMSAAPSRSGSIVPDLHPTKAPTKMRNVVAGPASEAGHESDATTAPDPAVNHMES